MFTSFLVEDPMDLCPHSASIVPHLLPYLRNCAALSSLILFAMHKEYLSVEMVEYLELFVLNNGQV